MKKELDSDFIASYSSESSDEEQEISNRGREAGVMRGANIQQGDSFTNNQTNRVRDNVIDNARMDMNSQTDDGVRNSANANNVLDVISGSGTARVEGDVGSTTAVGLPETRGDQIVGERNTEGQTDRNTITTQTNIITDNNTDINNTNQNGTDMDIRDAMAIWAAKHDEMAKRVDVLGVAVGLAFSVMTETQIKEIERKNVQELSENKDIKVLINEAKSALVIRNSGNSYRNSLLNNKNVSHGNQTNQSGTPATAQAVSPTTDTPPARGQVGRPDHATTGNNNRSSSSNNDMSSTNNDSNDSSNNNYGDQHRIRDIETRKKKLIIEGIPESREGDWGAIRDIFQYMGCRDLLEYITEDPIRLGNKEFIKYGNTTRPRRGHRLIKLVFQEKDSVEAIMRRKAILCNNHWFTNIYIKNDKTRDERTAEYNRRRNSFRESVPQTQANSGATSRTDDTTGNRNERQTSSNGNRTGEEGGTPGIRGGIIVEGTSRALNDENQEEDRSSISQNGAEADSEAVTGNQEEINRNGDGGQEVVADRDSTGAGNVTVENSEGSLSPSGNRATEGALEMG